MAEGTSLTRLAVFGCPIGHSKSPQIHAAFAQGLGLAVDYRAIECPAGNLEAALERFRAAGGTGCNITLPLKGEARSLAAVASDRVERAGAANTLSLAEAGWHAESTDGPGLVNDLLAAGWSPAGQRLAVLGAGGAAASVLASLMATGPSETLVFNRTASRAEQLATRHADLGRVSGHGMAALPEAGAFDLLIHATSLGHDGTDPGLPDSLLRDSTRFYDLNYGVAAQPLATWAGARNLPARDGLGMLVEQAAESFAIWTGQRPETATVLAALRANA